jgi:hypothetical protein
MPDDMNNMPMGRPEPAMHGAPGRKPSILPWAILLVVILAVLIGAVMFRDRIMPKNTPANSNSATVETPSGYQSVFLTNGQVYFGILSGVNEQYMTLKDIYYVQLLPNNLQGQQTAQEQAQQPVLRKLGKSGELHGPVDVMKINREQIIYYQEMTEESQVMQAIRKYQKDPNQAQAPAANTNGQAPAANSNTPAAPANNATPKK